MLFEYGRFVCEIILFCVHFYCEKIQEKYLLNSQKCITFALGIRKERIQQLIAVKLKLYKL